MELSHSCLLPLPSKLVFCYFGLPSQLLDCHLMLHLLHLQKIVLVGPGPVRKNLLAWSASAFKCSQAHTYKRYGFFLTYLGLCIYFTYYQGPIYQCLFLCCMALVIWYTMIASWDLKNISHLSFLEDVFFFQLNLNLSIVLFLLCFNLGWACVSCRMIFFTPSIPI